MAREREDLEGAEVVGNQAEQGQFGHTAQRDVRKNVLDPFYGGKVLFIAIRMAVLAAKSASE